MRPIPSSTAIALRSLGLAYFVQATGALSVVGALATIAAEWHLRDAQAATTIIQHEPADNARLPRWRTDRHRALECR